MDDIFDDMPEKKQPDKKPKKKIDLGFNKPTTPPAQGKSFKKIEEILEMESANTGSFDDPAQDEERLRIEERKTLCAEYKKQLLQWKALPLDDFTAEVAKSMIEKGMNMIDAMEKEILDSPSGRDVETVAAMMSSISGIMDMMNKKKMGNIKQDFEREKFEWKKQGAANIGGQSLTQNNLIFGTHKDLIDMIRGDKPFPGEIKDVEVIKEETTRNE